MKDARKAMCWSSVSIFITVLMLAVGAGLFAWYQVHVPSPQMGASFTENSNYVFPTWITMEVPVGVSGLILAGAFAAAISSLDSILAALSQTSLSVIYGREKLEEEGKGQEMVRLSRIVVCVWGVVLTGAGLLLWVVYQRNPDSDLIGLAFGMVAYTYGPLLGVLLASILPVRVNTKGLILGTFVSILLVSWFRPELPMMLDLVGMVSFSEALINSRPLLTSEWFFPLNASLTLICGVVVAYLLGEDSSAN